MSELLGPYKCPKDLEMVLPKSQDDWSKEDSAVTGKYGEKNSIQ